MINPRSAPLRAFTLVETLVAITVILTALVGPLYAVQQSLAVSRAARDQLVASSLAQEAVEYVRYVRDSNFLNVLKNGSANSWMHGLDGTGGSTNCMSAPCVIDPTQATVSRTITPLYLSATGLYNQAGSGTVTRFTRTVQLAQVAGSPAEMTVTVTVTWTQLGQSRTVTVVDRLHNWL